MVLKIFIVICVIVICEINCGYIDVQTNSGDLTKSNQGSIHSNDSQNSKSESNKGIHGHLACRGHCKCGKGKRSNNHGDKSQGHSGGENTGTYKGLVGTGGSDTGVDHGSSKSSGDNTSNKSVSSGKIEDSAISNKRNQEHAEETPYSSS